MELNNMPYQTLMLHRSCHDRSRVDALHLKRVSRDDELADADLMAVAREGILPCHTLAAVVGVRTTTISTPAARFRSRLGAAQVDSLAKRCERVARVQRLFGPGQKCQCHS
jgi:hypothetical protein